MATGEPKRHHTEIPAPKRENFADAGRTDRFYRFSVKCDREENAKIANMAKAAGMTPTDFVQKHFETIFSKAKAADNENVVEAPKPASPKPERPPLVDRLYEYMVAKAGKDGKLNLNMSDTRKDLAVAYPPLVAAMDALIKGNRVAYLKRHTAYAPAVYKVL